MQQYSPGLASLARAASVATRDILRTPHVRNLLALILLDALFAACDGGNPTTPVDLRIDLSPTAAPSLIQAQTRRRSTTL